jgi:ribonuclease-3
LEPKLFHYRFKRPELLVWALTHRSLSYESNPPPTPQATIGASPDTILHPSADPANDNEQLEFIGDAVLGLLAAEALFQRFPQSREGELTRLRASIVSSRHLGNVAARIGLGDHLRLGKGEEQSGGRRKPAILANALEAVIAALYLDGGLPAARRFVEREIIVPALPDLKTALNNGDAFSGAIGDHKSALQEYLQSIGAGQPEYVLTAQSGPDHAKSFRVQVRINDPAGGPRALAESEGSTKKKAQQDAARLAFEYLLQEQLLQEQLLQERLPQAHKTQPVAQPAGVPSTTPRVKSNASRPTPGPSNKQERE